MGWARSSRGSSGVVSLSRFLSSVTLCPSDAPSPWDSLPSYSSTSSCDPNAYQRVTLDEVARLRVAVVFGLALLLLLTAAGWVAMLRRG